jgi:hypothetical protein
VDSRIAASFPNSNISVLLPDTRSTKEFAHEKATKAPEGTAAGVTVGGVIGGTIGVLGDTRDTIEDIMLDRLWNNIMFAVCGFGGFLGMGEKYHPTPWSLLKYDESADAYVEDWLAAENQVDFEIARARRCRKIIPIERRS